MTLNPEVERVAEAHFVLRPMLVKSLKAMTITPAGQQGMTVPAANYFELWSATFADRWYDMAVVIRLGTAIETGLRHCYVRTSTATHTPDQGLFQRLVKPQGLESAFRNDCNEDLAARPEWPTMREVMLHRHLYAHRAGLVDEKCLDDLLAVTGDDIRPDVVAEGYPTEDVYWFRPLQRLPDYIETARRFFRSLP